jgi:histidyl-tRNA synthetase
MNANVFQGEVAYRAVQQLRGLMTRFGYEIVDLPVLEAADLFLVKAGDQIINRLFTFERNGQALALRPEFTAAAAFHYRQFSQQDAPVVRWQFAGTVFIDGASSALVEQLSVGAELMGMADPMADSEIMGMAVAGLRQLGLQDIQIMLGHTGLVRAALSHFKLDTRTNRFLLHHLAKLKDEGKQAILDLLDNLLLGHPSADGENAMAWSEGNTQQMLDVLLDSTQRGITMGGRTRQDIAQRLLHKRQRFAERHQVIAALDILETLLHISGKPSSAFPPIKQLLAQLANPMLNEIIAHWEQIVSLAQGYGITEDSITIAPHLARGWEYYTGIVFELWHGDAHLGGGGRYDELVRLLGGGSDVPAVGFAYYMDALLKMPLAEQTSGWIDLSFVGTGVQAIQWAQALREGGIAVRITSGQPSGIKINPDGSASFQQSTYLPNQMDDLLAELRRGLP